VFSTVPFTYKLKHHAEGHEDLTVCFDCEIYRLPPMSFKQSIQSHANPERHKQACGTYPELSAPPVLLLTNPSAHRIATKLPRLHDYHKPWKVTMDRDSVLKRPGNVSQAARQECQYFEKGHRPRG